MGIKETKEHETTILGCKVKIPLNQPPLTQEEKDSEKTKKRKKLDEQIRTPVLTRHKSKQKNTKIVTRKKKSKQITVNFYNIFIHQQPIHVFYFVAYHYMYFDNVKHNMPIFVNSKMI